MASSDITPTQFKKKFPELAGSLTDTEITGYITMACELSNSNKTSTLYLIAHLYVLEKNEGGSLMDGGSGEITSETMNRKMYKYQSMAESERDVFYTRTMYGRVFLAFEKRSPSRTLGMFVT